MAHVTLVYAERSEQRVSLSLLEEPNWQQLLSLFAFGFEEQIPSKICILSYFV